MSSSYVKLLRYSFVLLLIQQSTSIVSGQLEQRRETINDRDNNDRIANCPTFCSCSTWYRLPKATCNGKQLYGIQAGVPNVVQALDLSNNSIYKLDDKGLSRIGLTKLKYLNLSRNTISEIGSGAFDDLKNLMILDLSMNHIDYLFNDTFYYNVNLQMLNLSGNKFNLHVPMLRSNSITDLDLSDCRMTHLHPGTFDGLKKLRKLNIASNFLTNIDKDVLLKITTLKSLLLGRNPWVCDIPFYSMKKHLRGANIRIDHVCERPSLEAKFEKILAKNNDNNENDDDDNNNNNEELIIVPKSTTKRPPTLDLNEQDWNLESWREFEETMRDEPPNDTTNDTDRDNEQNFIDFLTNFSPLWFLITGFLLGSGATMFVIYFWSLAGNRRVINDRGNDLSCQRRIRNARDIVNSPEANSQRVSLLRHLWQQESLSSTEEVSSRGVNESIGPSVFLPIIGNATTTTTTTTIPTCPGTPPPPYREVMLHRNLYPRAAMVAAAIRASSRGNTFVNE